MDYSAWFFGMGVLVSPLVWVARLLGVVLPSRSTLAFYPSPLGTSCDYIRTQ
jgi:hypothetical protein